jgi:hypothetical protein
MEKDIEQRFDKMEKMLTKISEDTEKSFGFSDIFRYQKKFDAMDSFTNCEHDIVLYKWKFSDGYEKNTTDPVFFRFFPKKGKYSAHCAFVTNCDHPQTVIIGKNFNVEWYDILILRWLKDTILLGAKIGGLWGLLNLLMYILKLKIS